jgi:hypothetical protein
VGWNRPPLTVAQILGWADAFHAQAGRWPKTADGAVPGAAGEKWLNLDMALRQGLRSLPGGSSLAQLLAARRGVRNVQALPPLTKGQIVAWAQAHHGRTGGWPYEDSGPVAEAPGETWKNIDAALRQGLRGLPGEATLARLIAEALGVRNQASIPPLTVTLILAWADAHFGRTGAWPRHDGGPVPEAEGETWGAVEAALSRGCRGLKGGSSLYALLKKYRRIPGRRSALTRRLQRVSGRTARPRAKRPDPARRELAAELRAQGLTLEEVGARLGCSKQRVSQLLQAGEQRAEGVGRRRDRGSCSRP